jgi:hypothetical protein
MKKLLLNGAAIVLLMSMGITSAATAKDSDPITGTVALNTNGIMVCDTLPIPPKPYPVPKRQKPYPWTRSDTNHLRDTNHMRKDTGKIKRDHERWEKKARSRKYHERAEKKKDTMYNKQESPYGHNR